MSRRARWLPLALAPVVAVFVACAVNAVRWIERPFPGFFILENGIVVSIGRAEWEHARYRRLPFARVLAVDDQPVSDGRDIHAYVNAAGVGKPIVYTFRQGVDIFRLSLRVRPFGRDDFLGIFAAFLGVGLAMVTASAVVVVLRPDARETRALFVVCVAIGLMLITSPDMYSPYWFAPVAFLAMCLVPPAALQLALAFPQPRALPGRRPLLYLVLYLPFVALAAALLTAMSEPAFFLPLLYTVYFFMANGVLLNVGALVFGLIDGVEPRQPIVLALVGVVGACLLAAVVVATYPLLQRPISPAWVFGPLLLLPILEGVAFLRFPSPALRAR